MRILYLTSTFPYGPKESFVLPEAEEFLRQGHEILIVPFYPRGEGKQGNDAHLLSCTLRQPLISLPLFWEGVNPLLTDGRKWLRILRLLGQSRSLRVLLKNLLVFPKSLWLARIAREWQADHIHAHWASSTATMALIASEWTGIPWSVTAHRWDIVEDNLLSLKTRKAKFVRVISNSGENLVLDRLKPVQKTSNLFVIHMGVPRRSLPTSLALSNAPPVILTPASLLPVKGHTYLIRAMKLLEERGHPFNLWLAGEGELREALEAEVRDLHLEHRIRFLGQVPNERLHQMYRNGEVGVVALPSVDLGNNLHEGIPVSLMEAMSYRVPVIGTQAGGVPELLDGDHGLLVPPGDPQALADAIEKILLDPVFARELGARGQKRVEREFSVEAAVAQLVNRMQDREAVLA